MVGGEEGGVVSTAGSDCLRRRAAVLEQGELILGGVEDARFLGVGLDWGELLGQEGLAVPHGDLVGVDLAAVRYLPGGLYFFSGGQTAHCR